MFMSAVSFGDYIWLTSQKLLQLVLWYLNYFETS